MVWPEFIFLYQEMMNHFHHCRKVTLTLKNTWVNIDQAEKLLCIYKVEISGKCKVSRLNCISLNEGVAEFHIVFSLCTVPEVTEHKFAHKPHMPFQKTWMFADIGLIFFKFKDLFTYLPENICDRLVSNA